MEKQQFTVKDLLDIYHFKIIKKASKNVAIPSSRIRRIGTVFLLKKIEDFPKDNIFIFGIVEKQYIKSLKGNKKQDFFEKLRIVKPSLIILTTGFNWSDVYEFTRNCKKIDTTIVLAQFDVSRVYSILAPFLTEKLTSHYEIHHGTLLCVYGVGVLLTGRSGIGKSEAAMDLIKKGHLFVGDDAIKIHAVGNNLYGESSNIGKKFLAIKGIGILSVAEMFGWEKIIPSTKIDIVIELFNDMNVIDKTFNYLKKQTFKEYCKIKIRKYNLSIIVGQRAADLIETAVIDYKLKMQGKDPNKSYLVNFRKTILDNFKKKNE